MKNTLISSSTPDLCKHVKCKHNFYSGAHLSLICKLKKETNKQKEGACNRVIRFEYTELYIYCNIISAWSKIRWWFLNDSIFFFVFLSFLRLRCRGGVACRPGGRTSLTYDTYSFVHVSTTRVGLKRNLPKLEWEQTNRPRGVSVYN